MKELFGDTNNLKQSDIRVLEKLAGKRVNPRDLVSIELARKASELSRRLEIQVGLIIGRNGEVTQVVVGSKNRIYLPNLGRYRLDASRLRRLRFVVFKPEINTSDLSHQKHKFHVGPRKEESLITKDLITDLEKLRLDAIAVIKVQADGSPGNVELLHIEPVISRGSSMRKYSISGSETNCIKANDLYSLDLNFVEYIEEVEERIDSTRMRSYDTSKELAILVGAYIDPIQECEASMGELEELARTAGIEVVDSIIQRRRELDPKTLVGKGKIEEIVLHSLDLGADLLVFDKELSPGQLRSITNLTELRVIDRSMLILDIFAQRAKSSEGRLQVELAQLKYSLPRLTETDTGLSRLTGGIGGRGPGETKLEIGRRRVRDRISLLEKKIENLSQQRGLRRERRQERGVPVVAIVGYTNAGKSTLLNTLTKGKAFVENKLFATLDPSSRRMRFPNDKEVLFVDTVGFIRDLPKELVNAFRATLEEVGEADLLLHIVDISNPEMMKQIEIVAATLEKLGFGEKPRLFVMNKIDLLSPIQVTTISNRLNAIPASAISREGLKELVQAVQDKLLGCFMGQDPGGFLELEQISGSTED